MGAATLYEILGVRQDASPEEIRAAYRLAALRVHPDKRAAAAAGSSASDGGNNGSSTSIQGRTVAAAGCPVAAAAAPSTAAGATEVAGVESEGGSSRDAAFLVVQRAWEVLQDPSRRAAYDQSLALDASRQEVHVNEEMPLSQLAAAGEVAVVGGEACYSWPCRCGGQFLLPLADCPGGARVAGGGAGAGEQQGEAAAEVLVPCSTCSLHIQVATNC